MLGGFWPVLNRIVTACIWQVHEFGARISSLTRSRMGIETYWGGQSIKIILNSLIGPKFAHMKNTLPVSADVDTASLISFSVFLAIYCPMLLVPPEKMQLPLKVSLKRGRWDLSLMMITDCLRNDNQQHLRSSYLVGPLCSRRRNTDKCSRHCITERTTLEFRLRYSSHPRYLERRRSRAIWYFPSSSSPSNSSFLLLLLTEDRLDALCSHIPCLSRRLRHHSSSDHYSYRPHRPHCHQKTLFECLCTLGREQPCPFPC